MHIVACIAPYIEVPDSLPFSRSIAGAQQTGSGCVTNSIVPPAAPQTSTRTPTKIMSKKTWIPTKPCIFPPKAIPLGQVVCDPTQPHRPLSLHSIPVAVGETEMSVQGSADWKMDWTIHKSFAGDLWAKFFAGEVGSKISIQREARAVYTFANMRNQSLTTSIEGNFARRVLADAEVQEFLARTKHKQPIFVVTGVVLGEMGTVEMAKWTEFHGWLSGLSGRSHLQQSARFDVKGTVVLAYRMCRISVKSAEANPVVVEYVKGARWSSMA